MALISLCEDVRAAEPRIYMRSCPIADVMDEPRNFPGVQFHPEVTHALQGKSIFEHFLPTICCCEALVP